MESGDVQGVARRLDLKILQANSLSSGKLTGGVSVGCVVVRTKKLWEKGSVEYVFTVNDFLLDTFVTSATECSEFLTQCTDINNLQMSSVRPAGLVMLLATSIRTGESILTICQVYLLRICLSLGRGEKNFWMLCVRYDCRSF